MFGRGARSRLPSGPQLYCGTTWGNASVIRVSFPIWAPSASPFSLLEQRSSSLLWPVDAETNLPEASGPSLDVFRKLRNCGPPTHEPWLRLRGEPRRLDHPPRLLPIRPCAWGTAVGVGQDLPASLACEVLGVRTHSCGSGCLQ